MAKPAKVSARTKAKRKARAIADRLLGIDRAELQREAKLERQIARIVRDYEQWENENLERLSQETSREMEAGESEAQDSGEQGRQGRSHSTTRRQQ